MKARFYKKMEISIVCAFTVRSSVDRTNYLILSVVDKKVQRF